MFKLSNFFHVKQELAGEPAASASAETATTTVESNAVAQQSSLLGNTTDQTAQQNATAEQQPEPFLKELPSAEDKEGWAAVYAKLGRPENADGYELPVAEGDTGEFAKTTSQWMHEAGLSKQQAHALATQWNAHQAAQAEAQQAAITQQVAQDMAAMKQQWGANFDANSAIVRSAVNTFAPPEFIEMLDKSGLINSPVIANMFLKIGAAIGEDKSVTATKSSPLGGESDLAQRMWPGMN